MEIAKPPAGILCQKQKSPELLTLSSVLQSLFKISLQQPLPAPILLHLGAAAWISASEPGQDQQHSGGSLGMAGTLWISLGHCAGFVFALEHVWGRRGCLYFSVSQRTLDSI